MSSSHPLSNQNDEPTDRVALTALSIINKFAHIYLLRPHGCSKGVSRSIHVDEGKNSPSGNRELHKHELQAQGLVFRPRIVYLPPIHWLFDIRYYCHADNSVSD